MDLMSKMHYLQDVFQMTTVAFVSVINNYIKGLHLFWDTLCVCVFIYIYIYICHYLFGDKIIQNCASKILREA